MGSSLDGMGVSLTTTDERRPWTVRSIRDLFNTW
jgi:hypothetical protein